MNDQKKRLEVTITMAISSIILVLSRSVITTEGNRSMPAVKKT